MAEKSSIRNSKGKKNFRPKVVRVRSYVRSKPQKKK